VDPDDEGPKRGQKKAKMASKKTLCPKDKEEEGYMQRKSPALLVWYLPMINHLRALFGNPEDAQLMSWHASSEHKKDNGKL
jgi:hypothetical protein